MGGDAVSTRAELHEALSWAVERLVTKTATVSLLGNRYEIHQALCGHRVELRFALGGERHVCVRRAQVRS